MDVQMHEISVLHCFFSEFLTRVIHTISRHNIVKDQYIVELNAHRDQLTPPYGPQFGVVISPGLSLSKPA
jgi:hypothetical protein